MHQSIFARLEALVQEVQAVAQAEQTFPHAFVCTAMGEKIAATHTAQSFLTQAARANPQAFLAVLEPGHGACAPLLIHAGADSGRELAVSPPFAVRHAVPERP